MKYTYFFKVYKEVKVASYLFSSVFAMPSAWRVPTSMRLRSRRMVVARRRQRLMNERRERVRARIVAGIRLPPRDGSMQMWRDFYALLKRIAIVTQLPAYLEMMGHRRRSRSAVRIFNQFVFCLGSLHDFALRWALLLPQNELTHRLAIFTSFLGTILE